MVQQRLQEAGLSSVSSIGDADRSCLFDFKTDEIALQAWKNKVNCSTILLVLSGIYNPLRF
jgi:hypothetical protein